MKFVPIDEEVQAQDESKSTLRFRPIEEDSSIHSLNQTSLAKRERKKAALRADPNFKPESTAGLETLIQLGDVAINQWEGAKQVLGAPLKSLSVLSKKLWDAQGYTGQLEADPEGVISRALQGDQTGPERQPFKPFQLPILDPELQEISVEQVHSPLQGGASPSLAFGVGDFGPKPRVVVGEDGKYYRSPGELEKAAYGLYNFFAESLVNPMLEPEMIYTPLAGPVAGLAFAGDLIPKMPEATIEGLQKVVNPELNTAERVQGIGEALIPSLIAGGLVRGKKGIRRTQKVEIPGGELNPRGQTIESPVMDTSKINSAAFEESKLRLADLPELLGEKPITEQTPYFNDLRFGEERSVTPPILGQEPPLLVELNENMKSLVEAIRTQKEPNRDIVSANQALGVERTIERGATGVSPTFEGGLKVQPRVLKSASDKLLERPNQPEAQLKALPQDWQVIVQEPFEVEGRKSPGYVQFDRTDSPTAPMPGKGPEGLRKAGYDVPDFSGLPTGKYSIKEATKKLGEVKGKTFSSGLAKPAVDWIETTAARLLKVPEKLRYAPNRQGEYDGGQLVNRLMNEIPPAERSYLEAPLREAFKPGQKVTAEQVLKVVEENSPRVEVKKLSAIDPTKTLTTSAEVNMARHRLETQGWAYRIDDLGSWTSPEGKRYVFEYDFILDNNGNVVDPQSVPADLRILHRAISEDIGTAKNANESATARYPMVNPKPLDQMPGAVDILVRVPEKKLSDFGLEPGDYSKMSREQQRTYEQKMRTKFESSHYPTEGKNLVVHVRGHMETLPDGKKVFSVNEIQTDIKPRQRTDESWYVEGHNEGSRMRFATEAEARAWLEKQEPLLKYYDELAMKAVVAHAREMKADAIAISDAETAMMSERHDKFVMRNEAFYNKPEFANKKVMVYMDQGMAKEALTTGNFKVNKEGTLYIETLDPTGPKFHLLTATETGINYGLEWLGANKTFWDWDKSLFVVQQAAGMRLHYDQILPKIAEELTGNKGERVEFGEHQNVLLEGKPSTEAHYIGRNWALDPESEGSLYKQIKNGTAKPVYEIGNTGYNPEWDAKGVKSPFKKLEDLIGNLPSEWRFIEPGQTWGIKNGRAYAYGVNKEGTKAFIYEGPKVPTSKYRPDLIFRNPDGTPKTSISARMYSLEKTQADKPFTYFGKDRAGKLYSGFGGELLEATKDFAKTVINTTVQPMIDRLQKSGGPAAANASEKFGQITSRQKKLYGSLTSNLDPAKKEFSKPTPITTWMQSIPSANRPTKYTAVNNLRAVTDGLIPLPRKYKKQFDLFDRVNKQIAALVPGFTGVGRMQQIRTNLGIELIRRGGGNGWLRWTEGLAAHPLNQAALQRYITDKNLPAGTTPLQAVRHMFTEVKKEWDKPMVDTATQDRISQDFHRYLPGVISHVKIMGQWQEVVESKPFNYLEAAADRTSHAVAFREVFPVDSGELGKLRAKVAMEGAKTGDSSVGTTFDEVVRTLQGHPLDAYFGRFSAPDTLPGAAARFVGQTVGVPTRKLMLSSNAITNLAESMVGGPLMYGGLRRSLKAMGKIAMNYDHVRNTLERDGMVNRLMYNWSIDPTSPLQSAVRMFSNSVSKVTAQNFLNELQEMHSAMTAKVYLDEVRAGKMSKGAQNGAINFARQLGFSKEQAIRAIVNKEEGLLQQLETRSAARLSAGYQGMGEKSRLGASRAFNSVMWFPSYWMMTANQLRRGVEVVAEDWKAGDFRQLSKSSLQLGKIIGGRALQGVIAKAIMELAREGQSGVKTSAQEAKDEWANFILDATLASMGGPAATMKRLSETGGSNWVGQTLAAFSAPISLAEESGRAVFGKGRYSGADWLERAKMLLESKTPITKTFRMALALTGLIDYDLELQTAQNAFYRWRRSELGEVSGGGDATALSREVKKVKEDLVNGRDWRTRLSELVEKGERSYAGRSLGLRTLLKNEKGGALTEEQLKSLKKRIGEKNVELLITRDAMVRELADYTRQGLDPRTMPQPTGTLAKYRETESTRKNRVLEAMSEEVQQWVKENGVSVAGYEPKVGRGKNKRELSLAEAGKLEEFVIQEYSRVLEDLASRDWKGKTQEVKKRIASNLLERARNRAQGRYRSAIGSEAKKVGSALGVD